MNFDNENNPVKVIGKTRITHLVKSVPGTENPLLRYDRIKIQLFDDNKMKTLVSETVIPLPASDTIVELIYGLSGLYRQLYEKKKKEEENSFAIMRS